MTKSASVSASPEVLDEKALLVTVGGDRGLARELAQIFLQELDSRMPEMASAVLARDKTRLQFAAHVLRGSAASLSATRVTNTAAELETMARAGEMATADATFARLKGELGSLSARLTMLIRDL
jgi:two-component system sensor histidine kinase/response regulator